MQSLLVTIAFHPASEGAAEIAEKLYEGLNQGSDLPGLNVPTVFSCDRGENPPPLPDFSEARMHLVVLLADEKIAVRPAWKDYALAVRQACLENGQLFFPVQLHEKAYPLHQDLDGVNFLQAWTKEQPAPFILRRIMIELCRVLEGETPDITTPIAPIRLFLSHAKVDALQENSVFTTLRDYLARDQPVQTWIDSADIATNSLFAEAIEKGVQQTSLLCILTDSYASRAWCRREILLAKKFQRPIVVIRAVDDRENRSFPYGGNVPDMRWKGDPAEAVDLILKEALRILIVRQELIEAKEDDDEILVRPPELLTVYNRPSGTKMLYPEPPLGVEERDLLAKTGITLATPLERLMKNRDLTGTRIALSLSESTDLRGFGLMPSHLEAAALEISRYLLIRGAILVYGGHLGPKAYTERLGDLVIAHNARDGMPNFERIMNYRGWPLPRVDDAQILTHQDGITIVETPRPADVDAGLNPDFVDALQFFPADFSAVHRFAWARGMTQMRVQQTAEVTARVVLGGSFGPTLQRVEDGTIKERWYAGRMRGVLEEVWTSLEAGQPVFLLGGFGGAARLAADLARGINRPEASWTFQSKAPYSNEVRQLYFDREIQWADYDELADCLRGASLANLNPLTEEQNIVLAESRDITVLLPLLIEGLAEIS